VADLSRNVLDHASWFESTNDNVLRDPRVSVYLNDGRHHLQMQLPESYDLVALEPPPIAYAGVASLYSEEFYQLARTRLTPNGFISQWLPAYQVPTATTLSMIRSFIDVFPEAVLLSGAEADLILIGARNRIEIDPNQLFTALSQRPAARADLARLDLGTPREIVGMFVGSSNHACQRDPRRRAGDRRPSGAGIWRPLAAQSRRVRPGSVVNLASRRGVVPAVFRQRHAGSRRRRARPVSRAVEQRLCGDAGRRCRASARRRIRPPHRGQRVPGRGRPGHGERAQRPRHCYASRGLIDQAIAEFRQSLQLAPDSAQTLWHLGAALASKGELEEAAELLRRSVQRDPLTRCAARSRNRDGAAAPTSTFSLT
jgi:hypothetical protein